MRKKGSNVFYIAVAVVFLAVFLGVFFITRSPLLQKQETDVYFVDAQTMSLTPVKTKVPRKGAEKAARRVLNTLIEGHDDDPNIFRLIPNEKNCMTVEVKDEIAYVDLKSNMWTNHPDGRDFEVLTVYSIVNSLTNIDGIVNVRFTVDGEEQKDFMGCVDMRETFIPDYYV